MGVGSGVAEDYYQGRSPAGYAIVPSDESLLKISGSFSYRHVHACRNLTVSMWEA